MGHRTAARIVLLNPKIRKIIIEMYLNAQFIVSTRFFFWNGNTSIYCTWSILFCRGWKASHHGGRGQACRSSISSTSTYAFSFYEGAHCPVTSRLINAWLYITITCYYVQTNSTYRNKLILFPVTPCLDAHIYLS